MATATQGKIDARTLEELLRIAARIGEIHASLALLARPRARRPIDEAQRLITTIRAALATLGEPHVAEHLGHFKRSPRRTLETSLYDLDNHAALFTAHAADVRALVPADFESRLAAARNALEAVRIAHARYETAHATQLAEIRTLEQRLLGLIATTRTFLAVFKRTAAKESRP